MGDPGEESTVTIEVDDDEEDIRSALKGGGEPPEKEKQEPGEDEEDPRVPIIEGLDVQEDDEVAEIIVGGPEEEPEPVLEPKAKPKKARPKKERPKKDRPKKERPEKAKPEKQKPQKERLAGDEMISLPLKKAAPPKKEDEPEPDAERSRPPKKGASRGVKAAAVIVVILIILAALGYFFYPQLLALLGLGDTDEAPTVAFSVNSTAIAGELLRFDARETKDDVTASRNLTYQWDFGDGESGEGRQVQHYYAMPRSTPYKVRLTVHDEAGNYYFLEKEVQVDDLVVVLPLGFVGDVGEYDVSGELNVTNQDGLATVVHPEYGKVSVLDFSADVAGTATTSILSASVTSDGFLQSHQTYTERSEQSLELDGTADTDIGVRFGMDGTLDSTSDSFIDLTTNVTVKTRTVSDIDLRLVGTSTHVRSKDNVTAYPDLRARDTGLKIDKIKPSHYFGTNDTSPYTHREGFTDYILTVQKAENVFGRPSLKVNVTVDSYTKDLNGLRSFYTEIWVAQGISMPVRTHVYVEAREGHNETRADITMEMTGFTRGTSSPDYNACAGQGADHYYSSVGQRNAAYSAEFAPLARIPAQGQMPSIVPAGFNASAALSFAQGNSTPLNDYLTAHPDAYLVFSQFNSTALADAWNLTFGEPGQTSGYYVVVKGATLGTSIDSEGSIAVDPPSNSSASLGPILSYSAAEQVLLDDPEVQGLFGSTLNTAFTVLGTRTNESSLSLSLSGAFTARRTPFVFYLEKKDGSARAVVDAQTGQMVYVLEHDGDVRL